MGLIVFTSEREAGERAKRRDRQARQRQHRRDSEPIAGRQGKEGRFTKEKSKRSEMMAMSMSRMTSRCAGRVAPARRLAVNARAHSRTQARTSVVMTLGIPKKLPSVTFHTRVRDDSIGGDNPFKWVD